MSSYYYGVRQLLPFRFIAICAGLGCDGRAVGGSNMEMMNPTLDVSVHVYLFCHEKFSSKFHLTRCKI